MQHSVWRARTATLQFQQSIWRLSNLSRVWEHNRVRSRACNSEQGADARTGSDRPLDKTAIRLGTERTNQGLQAIWHSDRHSFPPIESRAPENDHSRRKRLRWNRRILRVA